MAKATLEFNLKNPEDLRDYNLFNNAGGMFDALFEISCNLKKRLHINSTEMTTVHLIWYLK